jgi:predicted DNA-binding transcriptional regulator AlpA
MTTDCLQINPRVARHERMRSSSAARAVLPPRLRIDLRAGVPARHLSMGTSTAVQASASHSLTAQGAERFVSRREMAAIMAVSLATIDRMVAEGMPSVTWGRRTRRFRPSVAIDWAADRGRVA